VVLALGVAAMFALWSGATQQPTSSVTWDAVQYYQVAAQIAAGQVPSAEAPYVYRLGLPWLVAQFWPADPARGFFVVNVVCALAISALLSLWLRFGVERLSVRLAVVTLFAAAWHGPIRYVHFNGGYVDPPFMVFVLLSLIMLQVMQQQARPVQVGVLTALTVGGTFVRETMLLLPVSAVLMGNPLRAGASLHTLRRQVQWFLLIPIAAGIAVIAFTHTIVIADTTRSFLAAARQWIQKPPSAYLLAWFTTYGPVLAILAFDWKQVAADLRERQHLLSFLGLCTVLAFFGGSDTERFVFWAMPVVYLLIGRSFERHRSVFRGAVLGAGLVITQALSERIFWPIPDPQADPAPLETSVGLVDRLYGVADRVLVIDHFHWNLWSSFGSRPFRLVRLALYIAVTALFVWAMWRRSRRQAR
jgi:fluoride ion exporter CrcB/FEX